MGRQRECLDLLEAHASLQRRVPDAGMASEYYFRVAMTHAYLGDHRRALVAGETALREGEGAEDDERIGKALYALAASFYAAGASREAMAHDLRAIPLLERSGMMHWLGLTYYNLAMNQVLIGELPPAVESIARCASIAAVTGDSRLQSLASYLESLVHTLRGDTSAAFERARHALETSRDGLTSALALVGTGCAHYQSGDGRRGTEILEEALEKLERAPVRFTYVRTLAHRSEARLLAKDVAGAAAAATRALELARSENLRLNAGLAERALGRIAVTRGDRAQGEVHLTRALETLEECGAAFEAGFARLDLARLLAARGEGPRAHAHLTAAAATVRAAEAPRRRAEACELARELGLDVP